MSTTIQRNFAGGEIAPTIHGRTDTVKHQTGLKTCRNFQVMLHGGVQNRPGTKFVAETKDSTKPSRLIQFVFNSSQTYVLEFGDLYMRVIDDGAYVLETPTVITSISQAVPAVVTTAAAHGLNNGDEVALAGVSGMVEVNGRNFKVLALTLTTFSIQYMDGTDVDSTGFTAGTGGTVARVYTITTPYPATKLFDIRYVQSADVVILVHKDFAPRKLTRAALTSWTLAQVVFGPAITPATDVSCGGSGSLRFVVSAIDSTTGEESTGSVPSAVGSGVISWVAPIGFTVSAYNIYKEISAGTGIYGFRGLSLTTTFDDGAPGTPDPLDNPVVFRCPFSADGVSQPADGSGYNPQAITFYQARLILGYTNNAPQTFWTSKVGAYFNFCKNEPVQDDDPVTAPLASNRVNSIVHLTNLGKLIPWTDGGEWTAGDDAGLTPTSINAKQHSYNGSGSVPPLLLDTTAVYLQARGSIVRDLAFDFQVDGYRGNNLSIFAAHLFRGKTVVDWTYQQAPDSIIWAVRSDGVMLGLTYVREQQIWGWHRHDTEGQFESVCAVPEGSEDALYAIVRRSVDGRDVRYVERFYSRNPNDPLKYVFMDSSLAYDGRNTGSTTMTISGGTTWDFLETLTVTASVDTFTAEDVGKKVFVYGPDGEVIRMSILNYVSPTVVTGKPHATVPVTLQGVARATWSLAVKQVFGLWHLEGKDVSAYADGNVAASPNNEAVVLKTVSSGSISFGTTSQPEWYAVVFVGLPYLSDVETLDFENGNRSRFLVSDVTIKVESTKGLFIGPRAPLDDEVDPLLNLYETKIRNEESYDEAVRLATGDIEQTIQGQYSHGGGVFLRQVDPVPATLLTVAANGVVPSRG